MDILLQRKVERGNIMKGNIFTSNGAVMFLEKVRTQGWLECFSTFKYRRDTYLIAEFFANLQIREGVLENKVGNNTFSVDATELGEILKVPTYGFDEHYKEDQTSILDDEIYLQLSRKFAQNPRLTVGRQVLKKEMTLLHRLLFWFVLKCVIPRAQRRDQADFMDMILMDHLDTGLQIHLSSIIISHIFHVYTTSKKHALPYKLILTQLFLAKKVVLERKLRVQ